jgi:putative thioredoxin
LAEATARNVETSRNETTMDVKTEDFQRAVIERSHELPVVVDFWAAWCAPCRTLGPALEGEAAKRAGLLELVKLDVDAEPEIAARYGIQSIPTVVAFRDGEPLTGFIGSRPPRAVGEFFDEHVVEQARGVEPAAALEVDATVVEVSL